MGEEPPADSGEVPVERLRTFDKNLLASGGLKAARVIEAVPLCWFCNAEEGKRSKEHIFPQWLLRRYDAAKERVSPNRISALTGETLSERGERPLSAHVNGGVCASCNNGWMSALEGEAEPIIAGWHERGTLDASEARTLARWFVKTAVNLNVSQPYRLLVPAADRHALASGIPERFGVELFKVRHQNGVVDWVQGWLAAAFSGDVPEDVARAIGGRILVTHIRIGELVAIVKYLPHAEWAEFFIDDPTKSVPLWPTDAAPHWSDLPVHDDYLSVMKTFIVGPEEEPA